MLWRQWARRAVIELRLAWYSPRAQRLALASLALIVAYASQPAHAYAQGPGGGGDIKGGLVAMVKGVVDFMIFAGTMILAVGIGGNWIAGLIATSAGSPSGLSHTWMRMAGIIIAFIGLMATIPVANIIIDKVSTFIPDQQLKTVR